MLIDTPGNVDRRCKIVVAGMVMSDFVAIPIEPHQITLHALPETFDLIHYARDLAGDSRPSVLGMILNKTDKRTQQYRSKLPPILEVVAKGEAPSRLRELSARHTAIGHCHRRDSWFPHAQGAIRHLL